MHMAQARGETGGLNQLKKRLSGAIDHLDGFEPHVIEVTQGRALRNLCTETLSARQPVALRQSRTKTSQAALGYRYRSQPVLIQRLHSSALSASHRRRIDFSSIRITRCARNV